jgi:hypothetical protein
MPQGLDARRRHIEGAVGSLDAEALRLERLGLEGPLARCHAERRYWSFLAAIHGVAAAESPALARHLSAWLGAASELPRVSLPRRGSA